MQYTHMQTQHVSFIKPTNKPNQKFLSNYFVIHSPTCFYNDKNNSKVFFNLNKYLVYSSHEHKNI